MLTADEHGSIISANAAVLEMFGYEPSELVDKSCHLLIQRLPRKREVVSLRDQASAERFSKSEMWQSVLGELSSARVVNAKKKDGSLSPIMLTSSSIRVGGLTLFALLFEHLPKNAVLVTCNMEGVVLSATDNTASLLHRGPREVCGAPLERFVKGGVIQQSLNAGKSNKFGKSAKHSVGALVEAFGVGKELGAPGTPLAVEVVDSRDNMYVVVIKARDASRSLSREKSKQSAPGDAVDLSAKGGVDVSKELAEEEVGYYTVTGALGVGQCGMVRRGTHKTTGVRVAVKTLAKETFLEAGMAWPARELELMRYLNHPNIVQLYDCVHAEDRMFLVLELVSGGELLSYCFDAGPLPEGMARTFFRDILAAVDYLHRKGIVHRDLKLENCLLDDTQHVKLIDFGLANFFRAGATLKTSCGSADYAAPELFSSSFYYGPPVDVWAMGVILFSMMAGEFPFENAQATLDVKFAWPQKGTYSLQLQNLVEMVFLANPDLRLTVEQMRRHEWVNAGFKTQTARPPITVRENLTGNVRRDVLSPRADVLLLMEDQFGFTIEAVLESVLTEEINVMTATYKMLVCQHPYARPYHPGDTTNLMASKYANPELQAPVLKLVREAERRLEHGVLMDMGKMRDSHRQRTGPSPSPSAAVVSGVPSPKLGRSLSTALEERPSALQDIVSRRERPASVLFGKTGPPPSYPAPAPPSRGDSRNSSFGSNSSFAPSRERSNSRSAQTSPRETLDALPGEDSGVGIVTGAGLADAVRQHRERMSETKTTVNSSSSSPPSAGGLRIGSRRNTLQKK